MGSLKMARLLKHAYTSLFLLYFIWHFSLTLSEELDDTEQPNPVKLSAILRNISQSFNPFPSLEYSTTVPPHRIRPFRRVTRIKNLREQINARNNSTPILSKFGSNDNETIESGSRVESSRQPKSLNKPVGLSKISGIVKGNRQNPQDLIRNALINHTLEHGGEQDLDKLVFSNLPNGSKLVLRTVRIIRTDEDGNPMDDSEHAQPTYWDVTLGNATDPHENDEEEDDSDDDSDEDDEVRGTEAPESEAKASGREASSPGALRSTATPDVNNKTALKRVRGPARKKSDLESSGSHSAANYHHLNDYGTLGREKEHGTTNFHGNTHGNSHKQTYTVTDGKDVKPYHGTEKGLTDYGNDHGKSNKDQGERFKTSKRKNKGRKVTGFKRVYHKEEYQRTEHFYDDEEAKKIAESFGLSEAKHADNQGTKGDKRKYQGVRTDYLDGKKHENEHGTHDGYNKGQHTTYKDSEKHSHHNNYGKSASHGSPPHYNNNHHGYNDYQQNHHNNHHPEQQHQHEHQPEYHPNHNYDASYSNPKKSTISQVPKTLIDQLRGTGGVGGGEGGGARSIASIISAPMSHSFTLTEFQPLPLVSESVSTSQNPRQTTVMHAFGTSGFDNGNLTSALQSFHNPQNRTNDEGSYTERRRPLRKRPRQKKMYFSPKHRPVQEDANLQQNSNNGPIINNYEALLKTPSPTSYLVSSVSDILNSPDHNSNKYSGQMVGENETQYTPYAPNFGPPSSKDTQSQYIIAPQIYSNRDAATSNSGGHYPKSWHWHQQQQQKQPRRHKQPLHHRPRPVQYSPLQMQHLLSHQASGYPRVRNQMHLAGIPLRHASALHRLGNRHYRYQTLKHHPKLRHPYEISTRKSDTNENSDDENDSAHYYFNHNQRYAKNHLTSTINPNENIKENVNEGIRNTLIDPTPPVYSTVIKVLPATMLNFNDSTSQQTGLDQHHVDSNAVRVPGLSVTQRPLTQADSISITTAFPQHIPLASQQQQMRPFIPKKNWLTFSFNLGNPDFKLGDEFGPSQHPFGENSQKASTILQGLRNGLFKPFGRRPHTLMASPSGISPQNFNRAPLQHLHNNQQILMFKRARHPIFAHNVVSYENFGGQTPEQILSGQDTSPPLISVKSERPKFYYNYKPNEKDGKAFSNHGESASESTDTATRESRSHKPTLKVAQTLTTLPTAPTTTVVAPTTDELEAGKPQPTQPPPFVNGIMDSVAGFFGRMG